MVLCAVQIGKDITGVPFEMVYLISHVWFYVPHNCSLFLICCNKFLVDTISILQRINNVMLRAHNFIKFLL